MKTRHWLGLSLLPILVLAAGLGFFFTTDTGFRVALDAVGKVAPGQFSYERVEGRLAGPLRIVNLRYRDGELDFKLGKAEFDWYPRRLFARRLHIGYLKTDGLALRLPATAARDEPDPSKPFDLRDLQLPLQVAVDELSLVNTHIWPAGSDEPLVLEALSLAARTQDETLLIERLTAQAPWGELSLSGHLGLTGEYDLDLRLDASLRHARFGPQDLQARVSGELENALECRLTLSGIARAELRGRVGAVLSKPAWDMTLTAQVPDLGVVQPDLSGGQVSADLHTEGNPSRYRLTGKLATVLPPVGELGARLDAVGGTRSLQLRELVVKSPTGPLALNARGTLNFADLAFELDGDWQSLTWPLAAAPQVASATGNLTARGVPTQYSVRLEAEIEGPDIPHGHWRLEGEGSDKALTPLSVNARLLDGELRGEGSMSWEPVPRWQATIDAQGLDPGIKWPDFPGKLAFHIQSEGSLEGGAPRAEFSLARLSGSLREQRVQGNVRLTAQGEEILVPALDLGMGRAQLHLSGGVGQAWDIQWRLGAPDLGQLLPGVAGSVTAAGALQGPRARPRAVLEFSLADFAAEQSAVQRLKGEANIDVSGNQHSSFSVIGEGLHLAGQQWTKFNLAGNGTPAQHAVESNLAGGLGRFALALQGGYMEHERAWSGSLTRLEADNPEVGNWSLDKALSLRASSEQVLVEQGCLLSTPTRLCIQGGWNLATGADGRLLLEQLELRRFASLLPAGLDVDATLNGEVAGKRRPDGKVQGTASLRLSPGRLGWNNQDALLEIPLSGGELLQAEADGERARAAFNLQLEALGQVTAEANIRGIGGQATAEGKLQARINDIGPIAALFPQVAEASGRIFADMGFAGPLAAPVIKGEARLEGGALEIPELNLRIQEIQLAIVSAAQAVLRLSGSGHSGEGRVQLTGEWEPTRARLRLNLTGEDFQIADSALLKARINPDLKLSMTQGELRIEGEVVVPTAELSPLQGGGAGQNRVAGSSDVVIVVREDGSKPPLEEQKGLPLFANVRVVLGDVRLKAYDFDGRLTGDISIKQKPGLIPRGTGSIEVGAADYIISGQRLEIERGRVLYSENPLDNPELDLRITRSISNAVHGEGEQGSLTAGAQVSGTLQAPQLTFFSDPPLPDDLIISYLVFGRALQSDEGASIALGKYLSPDLYVGYRLGMFDALNTFIARYRLTEQISVEASSNSASTGSDLLYILELR